MLLSVAHRRLGVKELQSWFLLKSELSKQNPLSHVELAVLPICPPHAVMWRPACLSPLPATTWRMTEGSTKWLVVLMCGWYHVRNSKKWTCWGVDVIHDAKPSVEGRALLTRIVSIANSNFLTCCQLLGNDCTLTVLEFSKCFLRRGKWLLELYVHFTLSRLSVYRFW